MVETANKREAPVATPDQAANSTPKHVLIVEDNELNLRLLKDILEIHGYDVVGTGWGSTAVELARPIHDAGGGGGPISL